VFLVAAMRCGNQLEGVQEISRLFAGQDELSILLSTGCIGNEYPSDHHVKTLIKSAIKQLRYCNLFRCPCVYSNRKNQVGYVAWKLKKGIFGMEV
jgi:hypothetical protein